MKKILVLAACLALLTAGAAQAATLTVGGTYSYPIYMLDPSNNQLTEGGGSIDISYLNGTQLNYLYCVDIGTSVYVPGTYSQTVVTTNGNVYGSQVSNAIKVAWLLHTYGVSGQGDQAKALQASIWSLTNPGYTMDPLAQQYSLYSSYLGSIPDNPNNYVSNFYWITPGTTDSNGNLVQYQALVAPTPIPGTVLLMGSGLAGLVGVARFRRKRSAD
jgi:hypothetical protein